MKRWRGEGDRSGASGALGVHKSGVPRVRARQLFFEKCLHPSPTLANPLILTALRRQKGEALTFIQSSPCENVRCRSLRQGLFVQKSGEAKGEAPRSKVFTPNSQSNRWLRGVGEEVKMKKENLLMRALRSCAHTGARSDEKKRRELGERREVAADGSASFLPGAEVRFLRPGACAEGCDAEGVGQAIRRNGCSPLCGLGDGRGSVRLVLPHSNRCLPRRRRCPTD